MTQARERTSMFPGNLMTQLLVESVLTTITLQSTVWRIWQSWTECAARRLAQNAAPLGGRRPKTRPVRLRIVKTPMESAGIARFELSSDGEGIRFRLITAAGEPILTSRSFRDAESARSGMKALTKNMLLEERYKRRTDAEGCWFEIRAGNNRVLWSSAPHQDAEAVESDLKRLLRTAREAAAAE